MFRREGKRNKRRLLLHLHHIISFYPTKFAVTTSFLFGNNNNNTTQHNKFGLNLHPNNNITTGKWVNVHKKMGLD